MVRKTALLILLLFITGVVKAQNGNSMLGFYGGIGSVFPTGGLHDNFDGCVTFGGGITGAYKHITLKADVYYGQPSFNKQNMFAITDEQGRDAQLNAAASATQLGVSTQLGYKISLGNRVSITPSTGIYWSHYKWNVNDIKWSKNADGLDVFQAVNTTTVTMGKVGWIASIDIDVRLHSKYVNTSLMPRGQGRYTSAVRLTPWVATGSFSNAVPSAKGCFVGLNVSYAGLLSSIMQ